MADAEQPIYTPFFGVMGATAAMVFCGKLLFIYIFLFFIFDIIP